MLTGSEKHIAMLKNALRLGTFSSVTISVLEDEMLGSRPLDFRPPRSFDSFIMSNWILWRLLMVSSLKCVVAGVPAMGTFVTAGYGKWEMF